MEKADFDKQVGQRFRIRYGDEETLEAELAEVTGLTSHVEGRESFSLLFKGPSEPVLAQRVYRLENEQSGPIDLFLVPLGSGPEQDGCLYEAVFN